jgi:hypothetical protein
MFHEPPEQFLYSAYLVETEHRDSQGTVKTGMASAFLLEVGKGMSWLVTNRHVLDLDYRQKTAKYKDFILTKLQVTGRRADDSTYTFRFHPEARQYFHSDPENDVVLVETRVYLDGPDSWHWHFGLDHLADTEIYKSIRSFDLVCYTGFPDQHDKLGNRPILRSGHIASDPAFDYSWDKEAHGQCVAYEGFSFPGSSGGPVFAPPRGMANIPNSRHGYLIGVNALHINAGPAGHSGVSCFYKSTVILEIIEQHDLRSILYTSVNA